MQLQRLRPLHHQEPRPNNLPPDLLAEEDLLAVDPRHVRTLHLPPHNLDKIVSILDRVALPLLVPVPALVAPVNDQLHRNSILRDRVSTRKEVAVEDHHLHNSEVLVGHRQAQEVLQDSTLSNEVLHHQAKALPVKDILNNAVRRRLEASSHLRINKEALLLVKGRIHPKGTDLVLEDNHTLREARHQTATRSKALLRTVSLQDKASVPRDLDLRDRCKAVHRQTAILSKVDREGIRDLGVVRCHLKALVVAGDEFEVQKIAGLVI